MGFSRGNYWVEAIPHLHHLFLLPLPLPACLTANNSANLCAETVLISEPSGLIRKLCVELMPDYLRVFGLLVARALSSGGRGRRFKSSHPDH